MQILNKSLESIFKKFYNIIMKSGVNMSLEEAASFYGDYSELLKELTREELSE